MNAVPEAECTTLDCSLSLYMGFSGDDKNSVAFQTGYEISQVNQYSVSTLYNNIVEQVLLSARLWCHSVCLGLCAVHL